MSRIAYVNGRYRPHDLATVHIEDRGYQFADGVYEVCEVRAGAPIDTTRHLDRLERSLSELEIPVPMGRRALTGVIREVVRRNLVKNGMVYMQVTRGVAPREHTYPAEGTPSALVITARSADPRKAMKAAEDGVAVISVPDNRWERVDIKSVSLLPNVMAKQKAKRAGAKEAWFVDREGYVTEGSSTNAWIVTSEGALVTRPAEHGILKGITRAAILDLAKRDNLTVEERPFTLEEACGAREAFITAATTLVMPVVRIDGHVIGNGRPGSIATGLRERFHEVVEITAV